MNERHLVQLAAVVDAGGVSEAAASLGLSQPAISRSLAMLEARVGEPLFLRGKRPLQPTVLGSQLATHGRAISQASRKASDTIQGFLRGTRGLVRVGGVPFFMDAMISRMVAEFQNHHADVAVQQSYGHLADLTLALSSDQIDIAIVPMGHLEAIAGFAFTEILPGRNVVACRPSHPLLRKTRLLPVDLTEYPWVAPLPGSPLLADLHMILLSIGMTDLNICYSGGSLMSVINYLADTSALAVLPHSVVFAQRRENRVTVLPFDIPQTNRSLGILQMLGKPHSVAVDRFSAYIAAAFDDLKHLIKRHENAIVWGR